MNEINHHINHYQEPGYEPIDVIQNWPGNGDVSAGQLSNMAPFYDQNENGIYEPMEGDYPLIRGTKAIFFIFNDDRDIHTETEGKKLGIEVHGMAYSFHEPADSALWNSVFVHYDIYNRSGNTYSDTYIGNFTDFDIGNPNNDYVLCDVQRGAFIGYNGTDYDPDEDETLGYHENLPALAVVLVGGAYMDNDQQDNPLGGCDESINGLNFGNGITDDERYGLTRLISSQNNNSAIGDPNIAPEYYNYLKGIWKDNTNLMYGGNGHMIWGAVGPECNFMFPGDSDPCNWGTGGALPNGGYNQGDLFWTTEEAGNPPYDIRGISVSGPVTFEPGDKQEIDLVFAFARNYAKADPVDILLERIDDIKGLVVENGITELPETLGVNQTRVNNIQIMVYPNPVKNDILHVKCKNIDQEIDYSIVDVSGLITGSGTFNPAYQNSIDLSDLSAGLYIIRFTSDNISEFVKFIKQ
ncbi:MAG: T9SS type A sorting domain-containing protein [Bacteroidales bacterium]